MKRFFWVWVFAAMAMSFSIGCEPPGDSAENRISDTVIAKATINASPDEVWAYMFFQTVKVDDSGKVTVEWVPEWECQGPEAMGDIGQSCKTTFRVGGHEFIQDYVVVENEPGRIFSQRDGGDEDDAMTYIAVPYQGGTRLVTILEYSIDLPEGADKKQMKQDIKELITALPERVKEKVESGQTAKEAVDEVASQKKISSMVGTNVWTVTVDASPQEAFDLYTSPDRYAEWHGPDSTISNARGKGLGRTNDWFVKADELVFKGHAVVVEYEPGKKLVEQFWGDAAGADTWLFVPEGGKTKVIKIQQVSFNTPRTIQKEWDDLMSWSKQIGQSELEMAKAILEK